MKAPRGQLGFPRLRALLPVAAAVLAWPLEALPKSAHPWEVWRDLRALALVNGSSRLEMRSSHCPTGCASDRHGPGDPRYLRQVGDEGVIFEENGPGAITRIWLTTGGTVSAPLPETVRIRFYFDGEPRPRLELSLPELFDGSRLPFKPPLVGDRHTSSGGFFSYVPMPYARGCRITLSGADELRLWFQLTHHRLPAGRKVATFTGKEDLTALIALLASPGKDPWPPDSASRRLLGARTLEPRTSLDLFTANGSGVLTELRLELPAADWPHLQVTMRFDGHTTVDLPATELFAADAGDPMPTRSALIGVDAGGGLYSWFPLPFERAARIELRNTGETTLSVATSLRLHRGKPLAGSGHFTAVVSTAEATAPGQELSMVALDRPGRWVGLGARLESVDTKSRRYLEGDERIFIDGEALPSLHGTGVEDFFGGGFYFDQGPFRQALHGLSFQGDNGRGGDQSAAYRLLLTDAVPFRANLDARLEAGPSGSERIRARYVAWAYLDPGQAARP